MTLPRLFLSRRSMALALLAAVALTSATQGQTPAQTPAQAPAPSSPAPAPATPVPPSGPEQTKPAADNPAVRTIDMPAKPALSLSGKADWDEGYKAITGALSRLREEAKRLGIKPLGHPLAVFRSTDDVSFRYDAMLIYEPQAVEAGREPQPGPDFKIAQTPSGKAVKFEHRSSYEEIESTYEAITAWLDEKGLDSRDLFVEEYLNDGKGSDDMDLQVDIYVFVK